MNDFVIAVDFDGTLVEHNFPDIGATVPLAIDYCLRFQRLGAKLILWTIRSDDPPRPLPQREVLTEAVEYCRRLKLEFWGVNENPEQKSWTRSPKAYAHVFIDDAAAGCPLIFPPGRRPYADWSKIGPLVESQLVGR